MLSSLTHKPLHKPHPLENNILEKVLCVVVNKNLSMNQQNQFCDVFAN